MSYIHSRMGTAWEPHTDFDEFYVPIQFTESDKMLGWCELIVPEYKELE